MTHVSKAILAIGAVVLSAVYARAATPSISGSYKVHLSVSGSEYDADCTFTQTDQQLTGTCKGDGGNNTLKRSVDGSKATWKYDIDYNGMQLTLVYTGTIADSGKIEGDVDVQPVGAQGSFTATPSTPSQSAPMATN
jgi:hypothetical protein